MRTLRVLQTIVVRGWSPFLIAAAAVVGYIYEWPIEIFAPVLAVIFVIGLVAAVVQAREREIELVSLRLRQLSGYFNRRFAGNSSLSIFVIIDSLFNIDEPKLWEWARACDMSKRIFNTWCNSFIDRLESDTRTGRFSLYLRTYLNELWMLNTYYHEFIEQFHEIGERVEIPPETLDQYNRFVLEYNSFVVNFHDSIAELKKVARTEIEAPSVKPARELAATRFPQATKEGEVKPSKPERGKGYYA
ncbi:hypothetical protein ACFLXO_01995 [Chloroflexota bacterium]